MNDQKNIQDKMMIITSNPTSGNSPRPIYAVCAEVVVSRGYDGRKQSIKVDLYGLPDKTERRDTAIISIDFGNGDSYHCTFEGLHTALIKLNPLLK